LYCQSPNSSIAPPIIAAIAKSLTSVSLTSMFGPPYSVEEGRIAALRSPRSRPAAAQNLNLPLFIPE
jgi:hypothetical protein